MKEMKTSGKLKITFQETKNPGKEQNPKGLN